MLNRLRSKLSSAATWVEAASMRLASAGIGWLLWPIALSIATAAGIWALRRPDLLAVIDTNKLTEPDRMAGLRLLGATFGAIVALNIIAAVVLRIRSGRWRTIEAVSALNKRLRFLLAAPLIAMLRLTGIEKSSPKQTLFFIACSVGVSVWAFYHWAPERRLAPPIAGEDGGDSGESGEPKGALRRAIQAAPRWITPLLLVALWVGYGYFFSRLAITNHHALNTRTADLGYYDNIFYQSAHGRPLACSFIKAGWHGSSHFDPILVLLSPLYRLYPRAELLLILQSVWLGSGVVPVYLIARAKDRGRGVALLLATAFALYPALHGANMYEFHSLTLITPLVLWALYFLETGATKRYALALALLLLTREDTSLLACFIGLYAILTRRPPAVRLGQATIFISLLYFVLIKRFVMESADLLNSGDPEAYSFAYYFDALIPNKNGVGGLVVSLLTNPAFLLKYLLDEPKILFLLVLFLPLLFLPFFARTGRVMLIYGLTFCLLASKPAVFTIHFQYSSVIFAVAFALVPMALQQIEDGHTAHALGLDGRRLALALAGGVLLSTALVTWKFGGLVENQSFRGGFSRVTRGLTAEQRATHAWIREQVAKIPAGAAVGSTSKMGPHISNRRNAYFYPDRRRSDYVFLDEAELRGNNQEGHKKTVAKGDLVELGRRGTMALFKRK